MATRRPKLDKQVHFPPFRIDEQVYDLSHLDSHQVVYSQPAADNKPAKTYTFHVTYSMHCFAKDYEHLTDLDRQRLMYHAQKESRPFCCLRYELSKSLPGYIADLPNAFVFHGGHQSYAICPAPDGTEYFISFVTYKYQKKLRLHVQSAYPLDEPLGRRKKVGFFTIAARLQQGRPLPKPGR